MWKIMFILIFCLPSMPHNSGSHSKDGINKIINYTSKENNMDHLVSVQTFGSGIHVEVTLKDTAKQNIVAQKKIHFLNS